MLESLAVSFLFHGVFHIAWDIILDRNKTLRKLTRKETITDSTKSLIAEMKKLGALPESYEMSEESEVDVGSKKVWKYTKNKLQVQS